MIGGLISGLIVAWFLTIFQVDKIFINVLQPFMSNLVLTTDHFYFCFGVLGVIAGAFAK